MATSETPADAALASLLSDLDNGDTLAGADAEYLRALVTYRTGLAAGLSEQIRAAQQAAVQTAADLAAVLAVAVARGVMSPVEASRASNGLAAPSEIAESAADVPGATTAALVSTTRTATFGIVVVETPRRCGGPDLVTIVRHEFGADAYLASAGSSTAWAAIHAEDGNLVGYVVAYSGTIGEIEHR